MKSKTKFSIDNNTIKKLFNSAGIHGVTEIVPLEEGEFNSVFAVQAEGRKYVIKIAADPQKNQMIYEQNMLRQEVRFYEIIREQTKIRVPEVYASDFSRSIISTDYFIMEYMSGKTVNHVRMDQAQKQELNKLQGELLAQLHTVRGNEYGYEQNGLHETWYIAIRSMVQNLEKDCRSKGKSLKSAGELLFYIDKNRAILEKVPCCLVNFDMWAMNVFYEVVNGTAQISLIDPERCFWGDPVADLVSTEFLKAPENKLDTLQGYNARAEAPISFGREEKIRYYVMNAYLGLIMDAERHYRYNKTQLKYWINVVLAKMLIKQSISQLGKLTV